MTQASAPSALEALRPVNLLLVEDQAADMLALERALVPLGQRLTKVSSGEEALAHLGDTDFAVILMDVRLPGLEEDDGVLARPRDAAGGGLGVSESAPPIEQKAAKGTSSFARCGPWLWEASPHALTKRSGLIQR